ncbi:MAG: cysteine desulfurase [Pseudomonadota bacterium]|jgi:Fe-S cluster assembly protein SufD
MLNNKINKDAAAIAHYRSEYLRVEKNLAGNALSRLQDLRLAALEEFSNRGFPSRKQEDWKYTSLTSLRQIPFSFESTLTQLNTATQTMLEQLPTSYRLVFINGLFAKHLSTLAILPHHGMMTHFAGMLEHHPEQLFARWQPNDIIEKNSFIYLNTAFMHDGAYIYLPANTQLESPIEILFIQTGEREQFIPLRNIIIAEENSHAVIIEKYIHVQKERATYFTSTVTECTLAADSHIEHYKYISEGKQTLHIGNLCATQQKNSQFAAYSLALSAALIRSDVHVKLLQPEAHCQLKGLYCAGEQQQIDQHTVVDHVSPYTSSEAFYKGVSDAQARAVFNGKVIVRALAIKSKAQQLNKNLLLSSHAEIDSKPQLEIFTDDIQCTHGTSIAQLDKEALFYLRSRGLTALQAAELLIKAFIQDILQQMPLFHDDDISLAKFLKNEWVNADVFV